MVVVSFAVAAAVVYGVAGDDELVRMTAMTIITTVAGTFPDRFAANVSLYGVWIVTEKDDSPHLLAPQIAGEMYYAFAEHDDWVPDNVIPDRATMQGTIRSFDPAATERVLERVREVAEGTAKAHGCRSTHRCPSRSSSRVRRRVSAPTSSSRIWAM